MQIQTLNFVDVTILLYLPADTGLDDLCFLAEWAENIVEQAEEKMILTGKDVRYIRHRVLPILHCDETSKDSGESSWEPETWKNHTKYKVAKTVPEWVKVMTDSESEIEFEDIISEEMSVDSTPVCKFVQTVSDAAKFIFPNLIKTNQATQDTSDNDSFFSDESIAFKRSRLGSSILTRSTSFSTASSFMGKNGSGKHVILAIAAGYDRDQLVNVRNVISENKVSFLPIGLGNRGMLGLGGYYAKNLTEIPSIQEQIINRLTFMV